MRAFELEEEIENLEVIAPSRSEPARRMEMAQMLLSYRENLSFFCGGEKVLGCTIRRSNVASNGRLAYGPLAAVDDRPRLGKDKNWPGRLPDLRPAPGQGRRAGGSGGRGDTRLLRLPGGALAADSHQQPARAHPA
jgi:hypothetical protein